MILERKLGGVTIGKMFSGTRTSLLTPRSIPSLLTGHPPSYSDQLIWRVLGERKRKAYPQVRLAIGLSHRIAQFGKSVCGDEFYFA
jgi:hypothetical protein